VLDWLLEGRETVLASFFNVLSLTGTGALCHRLAEYRHEFAIAMDSLVAVRDTSYAHILVAGEARVGAQFFLCDQLDGGFGLVTDYLVPLSASSLYFWHIWTYSDVVELHVCVWCILINRYILEREL